MTQPRSDGHRLATTMWLKIDSGAYALILPIPPNLAPIYRCLPHLRPAVVYSPSAPAGFLSDVDLSRGAQLDEAQISAALAAGWSLSL